MDQAFIQYVHRETLNPLSTITTPITIIQYGAFGGADLLGMGHPPQGDTGMAQMARCYTKYEDNSPFYLPFTPDPKFHGLSGPQGRNNQFSSLQANLHKGFNTAQYQVFGNPRGPFQ